VAIAGKKVEKMSLFMSPDNFDNFSIVKSMTIFSKSGICPK
jgi:hypothetical protein